MKKTLLLIIITSLYAALSAHATTYFDTRPLFASISTPTQDLIAVNPQGAFDYIRVGTLTQAISATDLYVAFSVPTTNSCSKMSTFSAGAFLQNFFLQPFTGPDLQAPLTGNSADTNFGIRTLPDGTCVAKFDNITLPSGSYIVLAFGLLPQLSDRLNPWPLTVTAGGTWESVPPFCAGGTGINNCVAYSGIPYILIADVNPFPAPPLPAPQPSEPSLVQLTNVPGETAKHPNWSPRGDFISYISNRGSGNGRMNDVWAVAPDGTNAHQLTVMPDDGFDGGTFEAYWIGSTGDLVLVDVNRFFEWLRLQLSTNPPLPVARTAFDGPSPNSQELLTIPGGLGGLSFAVSQDGQNAAWSTMISFSCPWTTNAVVAPFSVLNGQATTSVGSFVTSGNFGCNQIPKSEAIVGISFSPDASQLVLARASDPNVLGYDLEIYTAGGQFVRKLTNNGTGATPVINWNPSWSSNGRIAFASNQTGRFEIYTINPDGSNLTPITTNGGDWPTWSPDGSRVAFQSARSGNSEIYSLPVQHSFEFPIFTGRSTEPSIAVDPLNPRHAVVGFNNESAEAHVCGWSESRDGGVSWSSGSLLLPVGFILASDPSVRYTADGKLYYACLAATPYNNPLGFSHTRTVGIVIAASNTGAASDLGQGHLITSTQQFCKGINGVCKDQGEFTDRPALAIGQRQNGGSRVIACWTDFFHFDIGKDNSFVNISFSDDGRTWSTPKVLASHSKACTIGADGSRAAIAYFNFLHDEFRVRISEDSGATWNPEFGLNSADTVVQDSTTAFVLSVPYALIVPGLGDFHSVWQKASPDSQVFIGPVIPDSQGVLFRDPENEKVFVSPEKFLPGASASCPQLAGAYETTTATGRFRYKVWPLGGLGPIKPLFTSSSDLDSALGDLTDDFPGLRRIGDYTSVDCSGQIGWAAWTDLRNGKPEIWGAIIPLP